MNILMHFMRMLFFPWKPRGKIIPIQKTRGYYFDIKISDLVYLRGFSNNDTGIVLHILRR